MGEDSTVHHTFLAMHVCPQGKKRTVKNYASIWGDIMTAVIAQLHRGLAQYICADDALTGSVSSPILNICINLQDANTRNTVTAIVVSDGRIHNR